MALANPAGYGIIGSLFREEPLRTIAFATFGIGNPVGGLCGVMIGGAVADLGRWQFPL
jgi:hypothetical protein